MLFTYRSYDEDELRVVNRIFEMREALRSYVQQEPRRWSGLLSRITRAKALRATNEIEDIHVSDEDALAVIDNTDPSEADRETYSAVRGYQEAMGFILQQVRRPSFKFSLDNILAIHYMITQHDLKARPGQLRPGWIGVRSTRTGEYVHEGADRAILNDLLDELIRYMNAPNEAKMLQAAMTHLNLTIMHPFSDGNGRVARGLQTAVMANDGVIAPIFSSIEEYIGHNQQEYYDVLAEVGGGSWNPERDAKPWVRFCLTAHYRQAGTHLRRIQEVNNTFKEFYTLVLDNNLPPRCALALVEASMGLKVRRASYILSADVSENTGSRDLTAIAEAGLLIANGEKRGRYYTASRQILEIRDKARPPKMTYDPFKKKSYKPGEGLPLFS